MTVVTPTDSPKSVCNCCVIDVLVAFLCCPLVFEFSVGIGFFFVELSQISFFLFGIFRCTENKIMVTET